MDWRLGTRVETGRGLEARHQSRDGTWTGGSAPESEPGVDGKLGARVETGRGLEARGRVSGTGRGREARHQSRDGRELAASLEPPDEQRSNVVQSSPSSVLYDIINRTTEYN